MYIMCGHRQLFFFQCGPETPEGWAHLHLAISMLLQMIRFHSFLWSSNIPLCRCNNFLKKIIHLFLERGEERMKEAEKHQYVVTSHVPPTWDLAHNPGMCPDWELNQQPLVHRLALNPLSHTSQGYV
ncbi:hypothetical protein HJG60_007907 [Phyllostomus discolor]|uniref:Uncharacterized protein n=1 Tax=Phyllostomus discolor TaxID=89673 RepID=A0A834BE24_9CHIR|nr:hypothetical protein HJG60_007907 [Phyllostomus discolor]